MGHDAGTCITDWFSVHTYRVCVCTTFESHLSVDNGKHQVTRRDRHVRASAASSLSEYERCSSIPEVSLLR